MCLLSLMAAYASETTSSLESFNYASTKYWGEIKDINVIREIGGGTVVIPEFDSSCPDYIKSPFSYACKIMGEFLPPSLPLKVKVSCRDLSASHSTALSKVAARGYEEFGHPVFSECFSSMTRIKGVILEEYFGEGYWSYLQYIEDASFLTSEPDITITYNLSMLDDMSFSIDTNPGQKYDFVSVALRDLLIGMGFSSRYIYNPVTKGIELSNQTMTPFEMFIEQALGNPSDDTARLNAATKGELNVQGYKLYAPTTWVNGVSLNQFMGSGDALSDVLSYNFGRGTVIRSLGGSSQHMCRYLLGWELNFPIGDYISIASGSGSTSTKVPYKGSIKLNTSTMAETSHSSVANNRLLKASQIDLSIPSVYVSQFYPYQTPDGSPNTTGFSITILKKDGTWDLVYFEYGDMGGYVVDMNLWEFHCENDEYERTADGYLRACITICEPVYGPTKIRYSHRSKYCVVDYLPPRVKMSHTFLNNTATTSAENNTENSSNSTLRFYFGNIEGINRIILEQKRKGAVVANKIQINDFKSGFFDLPIDRSITYTFTAVGYNDNGYTRSLPLTIEAVSTASKVQTLSYTLENGIMKFATDDDQTLHLDYVISPIGIDGSQTTVSGYTDSSIDLGSLPHGTYVIKVTDRDSGVSKAYKIRK